MTTELQNHIDADAYTSAYIERVKDLAEQTSLRSNATVRNLLIDAEHFSCCSEHFLAREAAHHACIFILGFATRAAEAA